MIDDLFTNSNADKTKYQRTFFYVARTPDFMKEIGLNGAEFTMPFGAISSHIKKDSDHRMAADDWHRLPEALQTPFLITKYKGQDSRFRIYTNMIVNGKYVAVGVDVKKVNQGKNKPMLEINSIKTVFAKNGHIGTEEEIVCYDEKITPEQQTLLDGRDFRQYSTIQELSANIDNKSDNTSVHKENTLFSMEDDTQVRFSTEETTEVILDMIKNAGIEVSMDEQEMREVYEASERLGEIQKETLETASSSQAKYQQTVVSSAAGTKILNNLEQLIKRYDNQSNQYKALISDIAKPLCSRTRTAQANITQRGKEKCHRHHKKSKTRASCFFCGATGN